MSEKELLLQRWVALLRACNKSHSGGPGGSVMCICGRGCGGSSACSMVSTLRGLVRYIPTEKLPIEWQDRIKDLRELKNFPIGMCTNPEVYKFLPEQLADLEMERRLLLDGYTEHKDA